MLSTPCKKPLRTSLLMPFGDGMYQCYNVAPSCNFKTKIVLVLGPATPLENRQAKRPSMAFAKRFSVNCTGIFNVQRIMLYAQGARRLLLIKSGAALGFSFHAQLGVSGLFSKVSLVWTVLCHSWPLPRLMANLASLLCDHTFRTMPYGLEKLGQMVLPQA